MAAARLVVPRERPEGAPVLRPQSIMLSFLGDYLLGHARSVYSGSVVGMFAKVGVTEEASRSMLTRMVRRGLLKRRRMGRRMYLGLTERSIAILEDGRRRVWKTGAVNRESREEWTLIGFSLPDAWTRQRHDLRSRLTWAGFGPLQSGLWMAPAEVDVRQIITGLGLEHHVRVFVAKPAPPTNIGELVRDAYDLGELASRYVGFLDRWDESEPRCAATDALSRKLILMTEWLEVIRRDPRLPVQHLPGDWPAAEAQRLFKRLHARYDGPAAEIAAQDLDFAGE